MANITNIYPHVGVSVNAIKRATVLTEEPKVPILYAPFVSERGPVGLDTKIIGNNVRVKKCYSSSEFISTYGELDFQDQGQQVLNIFNWLENGGGVLPYRLWDPKTKITTLNKTTLVVDKLYAYNGVISTVDRTELTADGALQADSEYYCAYGVKTDDIAATENTTGYARTALVKAKYPGSYYYGYKVVIEKIGTGVFTINVYAANANKPCQTHNRLNTTNYLNAISSSDYIGTLWMSEGLKNYINANFDKNSNKNKLEITLGFGEATESTFKGYDTEFTEAAVVASLNCLQDKLRVKCDYILDAGYTLATKNAIIDKLFNSANEKTGLYRSDIIFITDRYVLDYENNLIPTEVATVTLGSTITKYCIANYDQYLTTEDTYSKVSGIEKYVTPTYFLAGLIPYNEIHYGAFLPNAGKNRAVIKDAKSLSKNLTPTDKDDNYADHINYIELDSNSMCFMSQLTLEDSNTALKWINNVRCINKMTNEIEELGRNYLFEATTDETLRALQNAIEKYMNTWVLGRALNKCEVLVYADENDDTIVHTILNIRFTGTIEIISVEINIE